MNLPRSNGLLPIREAVEVGNRGERRTAILTRIRAETIGLLRAGRSPESLGLAFEPPAGSRTRPGTADCTSRLGSRVISGVDRRLAVLVHNAGIRLPGEVERRTGADGHEFTFAVDCLPRFLLARMILPIAPSSTAAPIVHLSSGARSAIDSEDPMLGERHSGSRAYAQSMLDRVVFNLELALEFTDLGIRVNALHPATLTGTNIALSVGMRARSPVEEGFAVETRAAVPQDVGSGG